MSSRGEIFAYLLGEGQPADRDAIRQRVAARPEAAVEMAELRLMLDSLRSDPAARTSVSPGFGLGLRHANRRRTELRGPRPVSMMAQLVKMLQIAAGFTLLLYLVQDLREIELLSSAVDRTVIDRSVVVRSTLPIVGDSRTDRDPELDALLAVDHLPVNDASFRRSLRRYSGRTLPAGFGDWLQTGNLLRQQREEHRLRRSAAERRRMLAAVGSPDLGDRIDSLAAVIARRERSGRAQADVVASSLVLRALLAAGSTTFQGPHQDVVRSCSLFLSNQLDELAGPDLARALAALSDLAVVAGAPLDALVARHAERMAREILRVPADSGRRRDRPALLSWQAKAASLADAGQVLKLAPAFGVHSGLAFRARLMIAAHLGERVEQSQRELPSLRAAQLYGFGDLVDREEIDRELLLWRPRMLLPDYHALYHLAFSKYPARAGWARFQRELRGLAAAPTPRGLGDAAALLLCLSSNFAAPGSLGMAQLLAAR